MMGSNLTSGLNKIIALIIFIIRIVVSSKNIERTRKRNFNIKNDAAAPDYITAKSIFRHRQVRPDQ